MAENLASIIKDAGIVVDASDKFRKKTHAEMLAETLQQAIQDDIEAVRARATVLADQAKAKLKKGEANAAKDAYTASKDAARAAGMLVAKYESEKEYQE